MKARVSIATLPRRAALVIVCAACEADLKSVVEMDDPDPDTSGHGQHLSLNHDVDILFVIDNSGSMGEAQGRLAADISALLNVLEDPAVDASYRIGVTTTDNGNPWCESTTPEAGNLQLSSCRSRIGEFVTGGNPPADATAAACTDVCNADTIEILPTPIEIDTQARPRPWVESSQGTTNLGGGLGVAEAFGCFAPQGIAGCGFESHLESMYKSLLRSFDEDEAQYGFLRSGAVLSVVIVSDEVDCSYNNDWESIFLTEAEGGNPGVFWSDPDAGAPTSAVCWNAGVSCDGSGAPYDGCSSTNKDVNGNAGVTDDEAVLHPVSRYADFMQELESSKQQIWPAREVLFALITGVPESYDGEIIYADALDPVEQSEFGIGAGCTYDDGDPMTPFASARPPVRERELAEGLEVDGDPNLYSICQESYAGALEAIGNSIAAQMPRPCMWACVADTDEMTAGLQPECTLVQETPNLEIGTVEETIVPPCDAGGDLPDLADVCFVALVDDALTGQCAEEGWNLEFRLVRREGVPAGLGTAVAARCELSDDKRVDCPNLP